MTNPFAGLAQSSATPAKNRRTSSWKAGTSADGRHSSRSAISSARSSQLRQISNVFGLSVNDRTVGARLSSSHVRNHENVRLEMGVLAHASGGGSESRLAERMSVDVFADEHEKLGDDSLMPIAWRIG